MAEITSRGVAKLAAVPGTGKMTPGDFGGRVRSVIIETPATHAAALNDTIGSGVSIPAGARFLGLGAVQVIGAGAASSTLSIGLRNPDTKVAIDAGAIATGVALTTAGRIPAVNGTYVNANGTVSAASAEVYATFTGANPTANQQIRAEVFFVTD